MASDGYERRRFWGRGTITAGFVLLAVLIAAIALIVVEVGGGSGGSHTAAPKPTSTPTRTPSRSSSSTTATTTGTDASCSLPAGNQSVPDYTPPGITWRIYQTVALPYSPTYGPQYVNGDIARCYAHDPTGALVAASQIGVRYLIAPQWRKVVDQQVVANTGRSVYISNRATVSNQGGNQPGSYNQFAGFKYVTYGPSQAVLELVTTSSSGAMQATTVTVDWVSGDWRLLLQPDGGTSPNAFPVTSLAGFASWAGV